MKETLGTDNSVNKIIGEEIDSISNLDIDNSYLKSDATEYSNILKIADNDKEESLDLKHIKKYRKPKTKDKFDDFLRNFLIRNNLNKTLEIFQVG